MLLVGPGGKKKKKKKWYPIDLNPGARFENKCNVQG